MQYSYVISLVMEFPPVMSPDSFENMRRAMVESQLRPEGVTDNRVLNAMGLVAREDFVPEARRATAYADRMIALPDGREINPPIVTGRLLNAAAIAPGEQVLIIGDASGYTAAVVRQLADKVETETGEGLFDVIVVDGAVEQLPDSLIDQLAPNGRLVTGVFETGVTRLAIGRRAGSGFGLKPFLDAEMAVLPAFARPSAFVF
jgi:protein-L-isoaspartate(D-aspartate) O-methyltransferase